MRNALILAATVIATISLPATPAWSAAGPGPESGPQTAGSEGDAAARAELIALDDAWIAAEVGKDAAALERILDERFVATFASGRTIDRNAYIEQIMKADLAPFEVSHDVIEVHGDTALVIDTSTDGKTKFTYVAVRKDGAWRVISETFTSVRQPE